MLRRALAQAEERNDEGPLALVLWLTAYNMLVGIDGPTFKVSRFLDITRRVRRSYHRALTGVRTALSGPSTFKKFVTQVAEQRRRLQRRAAIQHVAHVHRLHN